MKRRTFIEVIRDSMLFAQLVGVTGTAAALGQTRDQKSVNDIRHIKLFLAGDVMTGRGIDQVLPHPGKPLLHETYLKDARQYVRLAERQNGPIAKPVDYRYIWGDALTAWDAHRPDLRIVNLETSVTASDDYWPSKGINYRMHPDNAACLTAAQLDCCVLANNHVLDWGYAGLDETLATLRRVGIATAGAGRDLGEAAKPARFSVPGRGDVLVFAAADASSGVPHRWAADEDRAGVYLLDGLNPKTTKNIADRIAAEREPDDVVVLSIHWGSNWGYRVPREQRRFGRELIDAGVVDIVHGHSSHHPRPFECYKGKLILYGCGDFVNDYEGIGGRENYRPWLAPMYFVTVNTRSREIERLEIELLQMRRFQTVQATGDDRQWLTDTLNEFSEEFGTAVELRNGSLSAGPCAAGQ